MARLLSLLIANYGYMHTQLVEVNKENYGFSKYEKSFMILAIVNCFNNQSFNIILLSPIQTAVIICSQLHQTVIIRLRSF